MALLLAAATAAVLVQPVCSWDRPGVDRYRGTPAAALAHYPEIPSADRAMLARRIAAGIPDDTVQISRTAIAGRHDYASTITDMHFGEGRVCRRVTRAKWHPAHRETAAVYCAGDECVLVPQVCGNVSRVRKIVTSGPGSPGSTGGAPPLPATPPANGAAESPIVPPIELPAQPALAYPPYPAYPSYSAVPSADPALPPWAGPGAPIAPPPRLDYPGPGREVGIPIPVPIPVPVPMVPVPEPSTWAMLLAGLALLAGRARRKAGARGAG